MKTSFYTVPPRRRFRGRHIFIVLLVIMIALGAYRKVIRLRANPPHQEAAFVAAFSEPIEEPPQAPVPAPKSQSSEPFEVRRLVLHSGDDLDKIAKDCGIPETYPYAWLKACKSAPLDRLSENDEIIFILSQMDGLPVEMVYLRANGASFTLRKNSDGWECRSDESAARERARTVRISWSDNFYDSCICGGLPGPLIPNLADIFSYDMDLASDLKDGDRFSVFFQQDPIRSSEGKQYLILGAQMSVSGKLYQAFGFQLPDGSWDYYDAKGISLKRAFLRTPINFRTYLSPKTCGIKPFAKVSRPRQAVGYILPAGTRICAVGDGLVSSVRKDARGNLSIEILHRGGYSSLYGNLSSSVRGLRRGSAVSQGQTIGSAGSAGSGKAYLDFRFYKDSKPVNFQSAEFAGSRSVPKPIAPEFEKSRDFCAAALRQVD
ncbi:MAG TPA: peptidoglycan DD-metalloendopeptidase family protein [Syntrophobacteraceae bacterium]|nr:peptidoglycan DD-metalloendopeptidase family protein [Syntrophobacteraceae bacterium]